MSATTQVTIGAAAFTVPAGSGVHLSVVTATESEFRGTLEELQAIEGVTLEAHGGDMYGWVEAITPTDERVTVYAPRSMTDSPPLDVRDRNLAVVQAIVDEVRS